MDMKTIWVSDNDEGIGCTHCLLKEKNFKSTIKGLPKYTFKACPDPMQWIIDWKHSLTKFKFIVHSIYLCEFWMELTVKMNHSLGFDVIEMNNVFISKWKNFENQTFSFCFGVVGPQLHLQTLLPRLLVVTRVDLTLRLNRGRHWNVNHPKRWLGRKSVKV